MRKENLIEIELVNKESLPQILREIAQIREQKGSSESLIPHIRQVRGQVEKLLHNWTAVVQLYQEEFLSAQHMVMEEKAKTPHLNPLRALRGALIMERAARGMRRYEDTYHEEIDPIVGARVLRFLGRYADLKHQYSKSEELYQKALTYFDSLIKVEEKFHRLELAGFLANTQIRQGKPESFDLAVTTIDDFDQSPEGVWLKENDYYTWAVWKSGIEIRTAEYFIKKNNLEHLEMIKAWLTDAESILHTEGDEDLFELRLDELESVKKLITDL